LKKYIFSLFVDWLKNGESIKLSTRYIIKHDGLLIKEVNESDDGIYVCRAAVIQTGELQEKNIRLDIQTKPSIQSFAASYEAIEDEEFSIICKTIGKPPPTVQWIKNQKDVSFVDRFSVQPHNGQMNIARVEENDRGTYTCIAKNSAGYAEQRINIDVVVKPKIFELKNITHSINEEASLICKAKGRPPPFVSFRKWGSNQELRLGVQENDERVILDYKTDENLGESVGTMLISRLKHDDDGLYQCVARNRGDAAFEVGHITVEYPPSFDHLKNLPPVFSWEEHPANLSCFAMALPNATIEWRWNEKLVREMQDKFIQITEEGPRSDLIITPVERRYYSAYKCIAVNKLGRAEHIMELREARLPSAVAQAKPIEVTATTITFEIIGPSFEPGMPIKGKNLI
jgi:neural cell adhesion molecule